MTVSKSMRIHHPVLFILFIVFALVSILLFVKVIMILEEPYYGSDSNIFTIVFDIIAEMFHFFEKLFRAGVYLFLLCISMPASILFFILSVKPKKAALPKTNRENQLKF